MGFLKGKKITKNFVWELGQADRSLADASAATGTIQVLAVPANSVVHAVSAHVLTAVTGASAEEVGDTSDPDGWLKDNFAAGLGYKPLSAEAADIGDYAQALTAGAIDATDASRSREAKYYSTAGSVDYKITGTATAGKIKFIVEFEVL